MTLLLLLRNHGVSVPVVYANPRPFAWSDSGQTPDEFERELWFEPVMCKPTGEPIGAIEDWISLSLTKQLNLPMSVDITVNMDNPLYAQWGNPTLRPRLKVYRSPTISELAANPAAVRTLCFYGDLPETAIKEDGISGQAKMSFQDPRWHWNDLFQRTTIIYNGAAGPTLWWGYVLGSILINSMPFPFGNATLGRVDITRNVPALPAHGDWEGSLLNGVIFVAEEGKNIASLFDEATKYDNGPDFEVEPYDGYSLFTPANYPYNVTMGRFKSYVQQGSDRPLVQFTYADDATGIPSNCTGMTRSWTKIITSASTQGTDSDTGIASTQTYTNTTSPYGYRQEFITETDNTTASKMLTRSVGRVLSRQDPIPIIEISNATREAGQPFIDYDIGDTVYATCRRPGMEFFLQACRVHGFTATQDANGDVKTNLTIAGVDP